MATPRQRNRTPAALRRLGFMVWKQAAIALLLASIYALLITTPICLSVWDQWQSIDKVTAQAIHNEIDAFPSTLAFLGFALYALASLSLLAILHGNRRFGLWNFGISGGAFVLPVVAILVTFFAFKHVGTLFWYATWGFLPLILISSFGIYKVLIPEFCKEHRLFRRFFVHSKGEASRFAGLKQLSEKEAVLPW